MTTTPPPEQHSGTGYGGYGSMVPGNAELVIYVLAIILVAIIALASDAVNSSQFVLSLTVMTLGYLISRGIAKAGKVLER